MDCLQFMAPSNSYVAHKACTPWLCWLGYSFVLRMEARKRLLVPWYMLVHVVGSMRVPSWSWFGLECCNVMCVWDCSLMVWRKPLVIVHGVWGRNCSRFWVNWWRATSSGGRLMWGGIVSLCSCWVWNSCSSVWLPHVWCPSPARCRPTCMALRG